MAQLIFLCQRFYRRQPHHPAIDPGCTYRHGTGHGARLADRPKLAFTCAISGIHTRDNFYYEKHPLVDYDKLGIAGRARRDRAFSRRQ
jgi:hypothetical protein